LKRLFIAFFSVFALITVAWQVEFGLVTRDKGPAAEDVVPTD